MNEQFGLQRTSTFDEITSITGLLSKDREINPCGEAPKTSYVRHYVFYVITLFGVVSNGLVVAVFICSKRLRRSVSGIFLMALTISDTFYLISEQIDSLSRSPVQKHMLHLPETICGFVSFVKFSSRFSATVIVLCISINRFVVVVYPIRSHGFRQIKYAIVQIIIVSIVSLISGIYAFSIGTSNCGCLPFENHLYTWGVTIVDIILCDIIASLLISIFSIWTVCVFRKYGQQIMQRQDSHTSIGRKESERHMTVLLLTVAATFVLFRLPYTFTWTPHWFMTLLPDTVENLDSYQTVITETSTYSTLRDASNITQIFSFLTHAINLYLYCLCSKGFRNDFLGMFSVKSRSSNGRFFNMKMVAMRNKSRSKSTSSNFNSSTYTGTVVSRT